MQLKSIIFGIGVGVVAGLLCAPKKGSELRSDIKNTSKKAYDKTKNLTKEDVVDVLNSSYSALIKAIEDFDVDEVKVNTKAQLDELKVSMDELAQKAKDSNNINEIIDRINEISKNAVDRVNEYKDQLLDSGKEAYEEVSEAVKDELEEVKEEIDDLVEEMDKEASEEDSEPEEATDEEPVAEETVEEDAEIEDEKED